MESKLVIPGAELAIEILGYWPSFHDAEVISFSVSRGLPGVSSVSVAKMLVNVRDYKEVGAGTADYEYVCCNSVLIEFVFTDVRSLSLSDFNHQNVINAINIDSVADAQISVEIDAIWGLGGVIGCASVTIGQVTKVF